MFVSEALVLCVVAAFCLKQKVISGHIYSHLFPLTEQWLCGCSYQHGPIGTERA